ncbi:transposase [Paenibacillus azoreducens]|uniref:transposase n=1 Tax=Paenibacillus azoreducens TaxID=116718 RepID=UPI001BB3BA7B|nr:transposase [Paenibacillus azoreducens]
MLDNGVVLFCWKEGEELNPKQVKAFLSTDVSLTNKQILSYYSKRWSIETYFRAAKVHLGLDRYQVRSTKAIDRYWALLSFASMCCIYSGQGNLLDGLHQYR